LGLTAFFKIDELHRHNQNLVGMSHKGVPTVVYQHENCCNYNYSNGDDIIYRTYAVLPYIVHF